MPVRIQRKRIKGWRMPENTVYVGRSSVFGNCFDHEIFGRKKAVKFFRQLLKTPKSRLGFEDNQYVRIIKERLPELKGQNLACWCPLNEPCHADVLLELVNKKPAGGQSPQPSLKRGG